MFLFYCQLFLFLFFGSSHLTGEEIMQEKELLQIALRLTSPWKVINTTFDIEKKQLHIHITFFFLKIFLSVEKQLHINTVNFFTRIDH